MFFLKTSRLRASAALFVLLALSACSPALNWREVRGGDAPYTVLLPAKPASHARPVELGGVKTSLQMTAAEADDMNFAIASAAIEDESQRKAALAFMQQAMVQNIRGTVTQQKTVTLKDGTVMNEVQARGMAPNGRAMALFGRFGLKDERVYQVVAIGPQDKLTPEIADTFLSSFVLR